MNRRIAYWVSMGVVVVGTTAVVLLQDNAGEPTADRVTITTTRPPALTAPDNAPQPASQPASMPGADTEPPAEFETVNGIRVRRDRDCTMQLHYLPQDDGTVVEAHSCVPGTPPQRHPYESYSSEALLSLAYADAQAAEVLGLRLRETDLEMAMSLIVRAAALAHGDTSPLSNFADHYPVASETNGVPVRDTIRAKYVLSVVSKTLGAEDHGHDEWRQSVIMAFENPDAVLRELDDRAWDVFAEMHDIQMEVYGSSQIDIEEGFRDVE